MKGKERINDKTFQILELEVSMLLKWQLSLNCSIGGILSKIQQPFAESDKVEI